MATPHMSDFVTNGDFPGGGQGDWGTGMGLMKVFVNSKDVPVLTVPLNIEATLALEHGCEHTRTTVCGSLVLTMCVFDSSLLQACVGGLHSSDGRCGVADSRHSQLGVYTIA